MSLKLLCFGETTFLGRVVSKLRSQSKSESDEEVIVDNLEVRGKPFLTFSIMNPDLIGSQATGTGALLFFLDASQPIYEQRQLFYAVIGERREFEGLPVVVVYDKDQNLQIKEIVNYFELYKVKDRASMIKQIDIDDDETIFEVFAWIDSQVQFRKTKTFDAAPKVVKIKPKYRESEPESTENKYESIVRDKQFRGMGVKGQEEAYVDKQKERIKNENMEKQLANFNKNKKKMAPYDIKATPNPKIEANLHFFLKDPRVEKSQEVNIKIQTDEFKERSQPKPFIPKKTGVNAATQIESTELFDFDKEVQPILQILTTRALETATLEIEEQQECLKIAKYKNAYNDRVKKQKKHEGDNIQSEIDAIKEKDRILEIARKKDASKKNITKKQMYYSIANQFLQGIYSNAAVSLYKKNHYPNEFEHSLKIEYLPQVLNRALVSYGAILEKQKCLKGVFDKPCIEPVTKIAENPRKKLKELKVQKEKRRINKSDDVRYTHIYFEYPQDKKFSSFSKYLAKDLDGTLEQYVKTRQEENQEADEKLQTEEMTEAQSQQIKQKDNIQYAENHRSFLLGSEKAVCFSVAQNKYEKCGKADAVVPGLLFFDNEGKLLNKVAFEDSCAYAQYVKDLRYFRDPIGVDTGVSVNLEAVPDNVTSIVCYCQIKDCGKYSANENEAKNIQNSVYQLEFYEKAIPIHKQDLGKQIKWEQFAKPAAEGGQADGDQANTQKKEESLFIWAYHLQRKSKQFWQFQELRQISKPIETDKIDQLIDSIASFYKQSLQIFKTEEEGQKRASTSREKSKKKSRKNMASEKDIKPVKVDIKIGSRVLKEIKIDLKSDWVQVENALKDQVIDWKEFIQNATDGWYLQFRGKKLESVDQLKKFSKVGDLQLRKMDPPPPEKEQNENGQAGQGGEEPPEDE